MGEVKPGEGHRPKKWLGYGLQIAGYAWIGFLVWEFYDSASIVYDSASIPYRNFPTFRDIYLLVLWSTPGICLIWLGKRRPKPPAKVEAMEEDRIIDGYMMLWLPRLEAWDITYEVGVNKIRSHTSPDLPPDLKDRLEITIYGCTCMESNVVYRKWPGADWADLHVDEAIATKYDFEERRVRLEIAGDDHDEISERRSAERIGWGAQEDREDGHTIKINLTIQEIRNLLAITRAEEGAEATKAILRFLEIQSLGIKDATMPSTDVGGTRVHVYLSNVDDRRYFGRPCYDVTSVQFL